MSTVASPNQQRFLRSRASPTLREKLIKIGAKVVRHARYVTLQLAKVAVPGELFARILERIQRFGVPPPLVRHGSCGDRATGWRFAGGRLMLPRDPTKPWL